jgi:hypothetical protein
VKRVKGYLLPWRCQSCDTRLIGFDVEVAIGPGFPVTKFRVIVCHKCDQPRR